VLFLCYEQAQGLHYHFADWLAALLEEEQPGFEIVGLTTPREQESGLLDSIRARGVTNLLVVKSLAEPAVRELLARAAIVHCQGFRQLAEVHRLRAEMGAQFQCLISLHFFRNGTPWRIPFANYASARLLQEACDVVHFLSPRSRTEFEECNLLLNPALPCFVFPLGCRAIEFEIERQPAELQRWEYLPTLLSGRLNLVYLANFTPNKQQGWLIQTLSRILQKHHGVLWLLGDGPERASIQRYVHQHALSDYVMLPGHIHRAFIPWILTKMDVAVCCSRSENSPFAIMEPLFAGIPVVSLNVGTAAQLVSDFSSGFLLGNRRSHAEFARKVELLLSDTDLRRQMSVEAKRFVAANYTWSKCARKTLAMYRAILPSLANESREQWEFAIPGRAVKDV